jgi:signal transduction histidine kinase
MLTGLVASVALMAITYLVARNYLLDQRDSAVKTQALQNAAVVVDRLRNPRNENPAGQVREALGSVSTENDGFAVLVVPSSSADPLRVSTKSPLLETAFPESLRDGVAIGETGRQVFRLRAPQLEQLDGQTYLGVGVALPDGGAAYFEAFPLDNVERTLRVIGASLALAAGVTTLAAAMLGWLTSRRLMRPLTEVAAAATEIASGTLDARLDPGDDADLSRLARSFNDMADTVQARIEREARFASDVSHELRSPITALTAAVEVLDARRAELPDRSRQALDVVVSQVRRFDTMVLDLLELSRLDAGATDLNLEELQLADTARRIAQRYGYGTIPIVADPRVNQPIIADKRRLERILANLLENAQQHAGGPTKIAIEDAGHDEVQLVVEDAGPGVSASEKQRIFERFARGSAARQRVGTGLGLALVAEHAAAHDGQAWVEDRRGGGSRFVVALPKKGPK